MKWTIFATAMLFAGSAHAEQQCALHELSSFDLQHLSNGDSAVPVNIEGKQQIMAVDVSNAYSFIDADYGDKEGLHHPMPPARYSASLNPPKDRYEVREFILGNNIGKDVVFTRMEGNLFKGEAVGELAVDMLGRFDVELDFKNNKLNLFSPDHCRGKVVYWTKSPYAVLTYKLDGIGHPYFKMELDGKPITVSFSLWTGNGRMSMKTAERIFQITENSFGVSPAPNTTADHPIYRFPFKSLDVNGIAITNPKIDLDGKEKECRSDAISYEHGLRSLCYGSSDLFLGREMLQKLRLFFAFSEGLVYVTPADAH